MHSVDFWTREQILCVSKVDETKAMCASVSSEAE